MQHDTIISNKIIHRFFHLIVLYCTTIALPCIACPVYNENNAFLMSLPYHQEARDSIVLYTYVHVMR